MPNREVQALLDAVRRRLWRGLLVATVRRALWGSAALLVLATAATLLVGRVSGGTLLLALSILWALLLAWALRRRPSVSDCALWADRHLGGASAFSTLLELDESRSTGPHAAALQRLTFWATKKVPDCLKVLAELQDPIQLARPLLAVAVCLGLVGLVLSLPDSSPAPVQRLAATSTAMAGERAAPGIGEPESGDLANQLAKAARTGDSRQKAEHRENGQVQEATFGRAGDAQAPSEGQATTLPIGARSVVATSVSAASNETVDRAKADRTASTEIAGGREAGSSVDGRAGAGSSRPPQGTMFAQGPELKARQQSGESQANLRQQGRYDEALTTAATAMVPSASAVVAATPPTATEALRLTSTETSYVQAWMKASAQRR